MLVLIVNLKQVAEDFVDTALNMEGLSTLSKASRQDFDRNQPDSDRRSLQNDTVNETRGQIDADQTRIFSKPIGETNRSYQLG